MMVVRPRVEPVYILLQFNPNSLIKADRNNHCEGAQPHDSKSAIAFVLWYKRYPALCLHISILTIV